jgi:hypothetical protein
MTRTLGQFHPLPSGFPRRAEEENALAFLRVEPSRLLAAYCKETSRGALGLEVPSHDIRQPTDCL